MYTEYYEDYPSYSNTIYTNTQIPNSYNYVQSDGDRNFLFPFVLGGITGGLIAPAFYRPYPYYYRPYYYPPYPYYRRRW